MRAKHGSDFYVDVEWTPDPDAAGNVPSPVPLGRFTFGRRTMRDTFLIRSEYNRLTNGNVSSEGVALDQGAWAIATLAVLMVAEPPGLGLLTADPLLDNTWEAKAAAVFIALRNMELSFRKDPGKTEQAAGP